MILDFYQADSDISSHWLNKIDNVLLSEHFLSGLSLTPPDVESSLGYPVVEDIQLAMKMYSSQEIWDTTEPWAYQYYPEELEFADFAHVTGWFSDKSDWRAMERKIQSYYADGEFDKCLTELLKKVIARNEMERALSAYSSISGDQISQFINSNLLDVLLVSFHYLLKSCYFGGVERSEFFLRMFQGFELGGLPCGWVGGTKQQNGARAKGCLTMLHLGKANSLMEC